MDSGRTEQSQLRYLLWEKLKTYVNKETVIVSVSRESAATASYFAEKMQVPWEVLSCREIKDPANPNKTIGSVNRDESFLHDESSIPNDFVNHQVQLLRHSLLADDHFFLSITGTHELKYKTVVVVCDYLKNYDSVAATLKSISNQCPLKTIVASIVVEPETARLVASVVDEIVFLQMESSFQAEKQYSKRVPR